MNIFMPKQAKLVLYIFLYVKIHCNPFGEYQKIVELMNLLAACEARKVEFLFFRFRFDFTEKSYEKNLVIA
jgi:hypothetical protein